MIKAILKTSIMGALIATIGAFALALFIGIFMGSLYNGLLGAVGGVLIVLFFSKYILFHIAPIGAIIGVGVGVFVGLRNLEMQSGKEYVPNWPRTILLSVIGGIVLVVLLDVFLA